MDELDLIRDYASVFGKGNNYHYYIFSKGGVTDGLLQAQQRGEVRLITPEDLLNGQQIYNPRAVVGVMLNSEFKSYWSETASYETIVPLINMDFDGLKSAVIEMLSGAEVKVNTATFKNDTVNIQNRDEVLTYMIHLGYLGYDQNRRSAFVPNEEIRQELTLAVREIVV